MEFFTIRGVKDSFDWVLRLSAFCAIISFIVGGYLIINAPDDYLQGVFAKIMYVHIPAAWLALGLFVLIGISGIFYLSQRNLTWFLLAKSCSVIGCVFCGITLVTGSIWGLPTWGTWWVWDARLTSMLLLFFIYCGYIYLCAHTRDAHRCARSASVFAIFGMINIPIIKFSVNIWNTLHQGASVFKYSGPSIHSSMLWPLVFSTMFFASLTCIIVILSISSEADLMKITRLQRNIRK